MLAAVPWHYWIAVILVISIVPLVIATIAGYLTKVVSPRYPKQRR